MKNTGEKMTTLTVMVGLPGSGKSTYAKKLAIESNATVYSTDAIRKELTGSEENWDKDAEMNQYIRTSVKRDLLAGKDVIYDATNLSSKKRRAFLGELANIPCYKKCVVMATPYEQCLKNNAGRERHVPESVIENMYRNFHIPCFFEGWSEIYLYYANEKDCEKNGKPEEYCKKVADFEQGNHHHGETLGSHLEMTAKEFIKEEDRALFYAACIHDCGKPFTKEFKDKKGNPTKDAHYFGHDCVGSYEAMFFDIPETIKRHVCALVGYHMQPYFWKEEKTAEKYKRIWGENFFEEITRLHNADDKARILMKQEEQEMER